ncbi:ankyrin repeat domain-containing protein 37 [Microcaecilia unicolor]|uniref:Ankyrin repeat domain-containing protein 37 n=1 Tax=Microcaecilia unicolor TaxID=1415580 RepID=A0A6P7X9U7_9AMPH|nr:ankyrin repeat domain-containing protein 37 [Microcaecilia unicolor]
MLLLDCSSEFDSVRLMETDSAVNAPNDALGQSPAHMAAGRGQAFFLLWQLHTGADVNQQDYFGEAPLHKAAKTGSLACLSLLVASEANIDLCNKNGQTAEDLAWSCGFLDCAQFLAKVKYTYTLKLQALSLAAKSCDQQEEEEAVSPQKRAGSRTAAQAGKRIRLVT